MTTSDSYEKLKFKIDPIENYLYTKEMKAHHITLRQLQVFETAARLGSFTAAAEKLHLTQPTVSAQIAKLTSIIGLPLFEQLGRQIYLTEAGHELLQMARDIFDSTHRFEMAIENRKGLRKGTLRISGVTTAEYFAPDMLGKFRQQFPGITVSLSVQNRAEVLKRLDENLDDLYLVSQIPDGVALEKKPLLRDSLVVLGPQGHPLSQKKTISMKRLSKEPFLTREEGAGTRVALTRRMSESGINLQPSMELGSNEAVKHGIIGGLGIGILAKIAAQEELDDGRLIELNVEGFPIPNDWYVVYPQNKRLSIVASAFLEFISHKKENAVRRTA